MRSRRRRRRSSVLFPIMDLECNPTILTIVLSHNRTGTTPMLLAHPEDMDPTHGDTEDNSTATMRHHGVPYDST